MWGQNSPFPLHWPLAYTTACTTRDMLMALVILLPLNFDLSTRWTRLKYSVRNSHFLLHFILLI